MDSRKVYGGNRYKSMSEEKKHWLNESQKNYHRAKKCKKSRILVKQYVNAFLILWV